MGIDVVMKYGKGKVPKSAPIKAGRPVQQVIAYAGMILAKYTPHTCSQYPKTPPTRK